MIYPIKTKGVVIKGNQKGREHGFPTINILNKDNILPGIYAGYVTLKDKKLGSVIYIGMKRSEILEAHIFDFNKKIYGKEVEIEILEKIREDKEEGDPLLLQEMIERDCEDAESILRR